MGNCFCDFFYKKNNNIIEPILYGISNENNNINEEHEIITNISDITYIQNANLEDIY